jgi:hypothetical protein
LVEGPYILLYFLVDFLGLFLGVIGVVVIAARHFALSKI